ncbi:MAG: cupin domain-containing protein [Dehalococcoidia bacterium]
MPQTSAGQFGARILKAGEGETHSLGGLTDRFMIDGTDTDRRFALVQHLFEPRALAAPVHRHRSEDEYTYVLEGRIGAMLGDGEYFADVGDLIFKPRDQWHTFWNAGDGAASVLEIISGAGFEDFFRELGNFTGELDPEAMATMAARYGCDVDFDATFPIIERHRLNF